MKKFLIMLIAPCIALCLSACGENPSEQHGGQSYSQIAGENNENSENSSVDINAAASKSESSSTDINDAASKNDEKEQTQIQIKIQIGDKTFTAELEDNEAAKEFARMLPISVEMRDYGGFEKVGALGKSLTSNDSQTTTETGDIVLYNSDQIVIFYGSNSWSYTRLGHIDNFGDIGGGNITAVFSLE